MTKTQKTPRELLKKSHAHRSKKDYKRSTPSQENTWQDEINGCPHLNEIDWDGLPDNAGAKE